jgi:hypothetical protein
MAKKYNAGAPKVGGQAPDFELWDVMARIPDDFLIIVVIKPVALIFGGFT